MFDCPPIFNLEDVHNNVIWYPVFSGARNVYIFSQLVYTVGSLTLAIWRHRVAVILLSPTAGIMYAILFTMPYILVAHYHSNDTVSADIYCWICSPHVCNMSYILYTTHNNSYKLKHHIYDLFW